MSLHWLVDDTRDLGADIITRTYEASITVARMLARLEITHIMLDHDLGSRLQNETGYDLLKEILEKSHRPKVQVITSNPVGRDRIVELLKDHGYTKENDGWWTPSSIPPVRSYYQWIPQSPYQ